MITIARILFNAFNKIFGRFFYIFSKTNLFQFLYTTLIILLLFFWLSDHNSINKLSKNINNLYHTNEKPVATIDVNDDPYSITDYNNILFQILLNFEYIIIETNYSILIHSFNDKTKDIYCNQYYLSFNLISQEFKKIKLIRLTERNYLPPIFIDKLRI